MTAVSNSQRWVLMNAYFTRIPCDLRRFPIGSPLVLTTTKWCPLKPGKSRMSPFHFLPSLGLHFL